MTAVHKNMGPTKILVKDLNPCITCSLCRGYFVDATALVDCLHVFCRACILRYFDNFKLACPTCNMVYKKKSNPCFRSDSAIQSLVYKVVPGLYSKEVQRREDFYRSTGVRAGSSCSEDSVLGDLSDEHEEWVLSTSDQNQYFSPDEVISLSLEYYKPYLDTTNNSTETKSTNFCDLQTLDKLSDSVTDKTQNCDVNSVGDDKISDSANKERIESGDDFCDNRRDADRRYLRCPAAVTMSHLQKFLRMKYALSIEHRVDIIYLGEVLASHFSLMDVAYTFKWKRIKPMRFFFRIFTPAKIQPIKIINTSSMGGKQLQVVLSKNNAFPQNIPIAETKLDTIKEDDSIVTDITDDQNYRNKERLMANLQLQSKSKVLGKAAELNGKSYKIERLKSVKAGESREDSTTCIYEYEEPDKDEIRAFAEKRDREWALQKQLDEEKEKHRNGKKRKKSKHSKSNLLYKKRKLHAEITSNDSLQKEESLKLKVKIMPHNGYKHKHHKSSQNHSFDASPKAEMSSKEKLLQMRQVRHKHISSEDKTKSSSHNNNSSHGEDKSDDDKSESITQVPKPTESVEPLKVILKPTVDNLVNPVPKESPPPAVKILNKDSNLNKCPTVQLERHEQVERQAQKTFLKTFQSYTEKYSQARDNNIANSKTRLTYPARNLTTTRALEQKIQSLHQNCTTVESKPVSKLSLKINKKLATAEKPNLYSSSGFTVSKVEVGVKRKLEDNQNLQEKFPSLEITLINPPSTEKPTLPPNIAKVTPATISKTISSVVPKTVLPVVVAGTTPAPIIRPILSPTVRTTVVPTVVRPASSPTVRTTPSPTVRTTPSPTVRTTPSPTVRTTPSPTVRTTVSPTIRATPSTTVPKSNPPQIIGKPNLTTDVKHVAKRPPPATIPLEKIKKSMNRMSSGGANIIPKSADKCDNSGALDLTKPNKNTETAKPPENQVPNGATFATTKLTEKPMTAAERNIHLSNLQMLSKVATEHPNINKTSSVNGPSNGNKKQQMPSLQTLKVPSLQTLNQKSNLAKLPKLTEISKTQFRLPNPQMKNMRPNQNQSIRNIPNPSLLLMRQQNQNRLNSTPSNPTESNEIPKVPTADASSLDKSESVVEKKQ